ncbi:MAG: protein kinase [Clostridia bacterium]|nr:protein kinase [Clostridia bacterium]
MKINNRYEMTAIGEENRSKVRFGRDLVTKREIAVKTHRYQGVGATVEKEILQAVAHEHLPQLVDVFMLEDLEHLVTMKIEGITLSDRIKEGPLEEWELIAYLKQLCDAVAYLHTHPRGIVHGDIAPNNIMVNERHHLTLIDFGAGMFMDTCVSTMSDKRYGTVGYAAPENLLYPEMSGWQSDVYGIGAVLKRCMEKNPEIYSMELALICKKATAIKPKHRYSNVQQLKEDLELLV